MYTHIHILLLGCFAGVILCGAGKGCLQMSDVTRLATPTGSNDSVAQDVPSNE